MKTIEVTRSVYADRRNTEHLVTFRFGFDSEGELEYFNTSSNVFDPMAGMGWTQGREYVAELDYQKDQAYQLALEQVEAVNES